MRTHPHVYEANARLLLREIRERHKHPFTLSTIPQEEWQALSGKGFDLLWLMGVWQRSPGARQKALADAGLRRAYDQALPGWTDEDVAGSPYAVYSYTLDAALGNTEDLATLRSRLNRQGLGLLLDFVPNHLALDHPWTSTHPERFVQGSRGNTKAHPDWFFSSDGNILLAHGRDPYFPPWTDTVQVDFYSADLRQALINELLRVSEVADGVRCDMAMLGLNHVFERIWGEFRGDFPRPATEFWAEAIERVKQHRPGFVFLAEAYWDLEGELQELGFDFTYDKTLYDRLRSSPPGDIRGYLMMDAIRHRRSVRFIENHDEARAVTAFGHERSLAAAAVVTTLPGLRLFHHGQLEGQRVRLPIQLVRAPEEAGDSEISRFYERLLSVCDGPAFHEGEWRLLKASPASEGHESHQNLLAWSWRCPDLCKAVIVNYSAETARGRLELPTAWRHGEVLSVRDELAAIGESGCAVRADASALSVELGPWQTRILDMPPR